MAVLPPPLTREHAVFLDFDGTLVSIAPTPDAIDVPAAVGQVLADTAERLDGAVAIVTGRTIADIGSHIQTSHLAVSGSHGVEQRLPDGRLLEPEDDVRAAAAAIQAELRSRLLDDHPELLIEAKAWSAALHYRATPALEEICVATMDAVVSAFPAWEVIRGDMLIEARLAGISKASAVARLMGQAPFAGRVPVFVGDDVTDEDGIAEAQRRGGYGIKVGEAESIAEFRLEGPEAVLGYLGGADLTSGR